MGKKNTFKFQNFAERIKNVKIDVYHQTTKTDTLDDEYKDTFFREGLEKWSELNCTIDFTLFYRSARPLVQSFNLLVYNKDKVVELLKTYLSKPDCLCIEPCLDLLVQLSKDLQVDFYPLFSDFFSLLVDLLRRDDIDIMENVFITLAYLFKSLWTYIVKDICHVFDWYKCLLKEQRKAHIREFAAESFAFLIRKVKCRQEIFQHIFNQVFVDESLCCGVGYLLFHAIKGIKHQFNFNAKSIIDDLFYLLKQSCNNHSEINEHQKILDILLVTWTSSLKFTKPEYSSVLVNPLLQLIKVDQVNSAFVRCLIELIIPCVTEKSGSLVADLKDVCNIISDLSLNSADNSSCYKSKLMLLAKVFLQTDNKAIVKENVSKVYQSVIHTKFYSLEEKLTFTADLLKCSWFDSIIQPAIMKLIDSYVEGREQCKSYSAEKCCLLMSQIVNRHTDFAKPTELHSADIIKLELSLSSCSTLVKDVSVKLWNKESFPYLWSLLCCVPHFPVTEDDNRAANIQEVVKHGLTVTLDGNSSDESLCVLSEAIHALIVMSSSKPAIIERTLQEFPKVLKLHSSNINILLALDLFSQYFTNEMEIYSFDSLFQDLKCNLLSPISLVRLLTLRILKRYLDVAHPNIDSYLIAKASLQACLDAENIDVTFFSFKERLLHLRKLVWGGPTESTEDATAFQIGLLFLIGNLFINFSPLWEPVSELIASYAQASGDLFWNMWKTVLVKASEDVEGLQLEEDLKPSQSKDSPTFFDSVIETQTKDDSRADFVNFRILVWKCMALFADLSERKSRDIVPVFLQFVEKEYYLNDEVMARHQDLCKSSQIVDETDCDMNNDLSPESEPSGEIVEDEKENDNVVTLNSVEASKQKTFVKLNKKMRIKTMASCLKLFSLFKNPKALSKEPKLYQLYLELLTNKEGDLQSLAVNCLMTYKFPYMVTYAENFDKLLNDTTFRDELMLFTSAGDDKLVQDDHRSNVMPILIRLLYGKLQRRSGLGVSGKTSSSSRKNIIIQFLSNCDKDDISTFMRLVLDPVAGLKKLVIGSKDEAVDLSSTVPIKRQTGFLFMLGSIISRLSQLVRDYLPELFDMLLRILWHSSVCLSDKDKITPANVRRLKDTRNQSLTRLGDFFTTISDFDYTKHLHQIFYAAVWPQLSLLPVESLLNVTPLMNLLVLWSKHDQFIPFLQYQNESESNDCKAPIYYLIQLLKKEKVCTTVANHVMHISNRLLVPVQKIQTSLAEDAMAEHADIGESRLAIIKPYVHDLLEVIYKKLSALTSNMNVKKKQNLGKLIPSVYFSVLSSISKFITDEESCNNLVKILFPLVRCVSVDEMQLDILTTINNMLPYIKSPSHLIPETDVLFSTIHSRKSRQLLCELHGILSKGDEQLMTIHDIVQSLNAWDKKQLDEPDYMRRLDGFREATVEILKENTQSSLIRPLLYNAVYILLHVDDLSLINASSSLIEKIISTVAQREDLFHDLIAQIIIPSIQNGLKSKRDNCRTEFVNILSLLVKTLDNSGLADLKVLCSDDADKDFFQNIAHIQSHRKIKAVHQLSELCQEKKIAPSNLFKMLLPMISHFIFDTRAAKEHNLVTETICAIGAIVKCLPWGKYFFVLSGYMKLLPKKKKNHKMLIRVIVSILDSFHFDLSQVENEAGIITNTKVNTPALDEKDEEEDDEDSSKDEIDEVIDDVNDHTESNINEKEDRRKANQHIVHVITKRVIPQLQRGLNKASQSQLVHKLSRVKDDDEDLLLHIPIALALIKLLKFLPKSVLDSNLPGILVKVCQALRSHARDVRDTARDTLIKIAQCLGAIYIPMIIKDLQSALLRGYQLHILGYTIHSLIEGLKETIVAGDLDHSLDSLMKILVEELCGNVAEEKTVAGITSKLHEARSKKTQACFQLVAQYISKGCVTQMVSPLSDVLETTLSHKTVNKVEEALRRISHGLQSNKDFTDEDLLVFTHSIISKTLVDSKQEKSNEAVQPAKPSSFDSDIYLVPQAPSRSGPNPTSNKETNDHILIEFGLQLLHASLKRRDRLSLKDEDALKMLDPFVKIVSKCMMSKYNKIVTLALRCNSFLLRFPLPSYKKEISGITKGVFKLLKRYNSAGGGGADNLELTITCFKAMTIIIKDYKEHQVTNKQLQILLSFIDEDIHNRNRQTTAFPLLKVILSRKLQHSSLHDVMTKVRELAVSDFDPTTRLECRQAMMKYLLDYPIGKQLDQHLDFYISQLSFDEETGRISTLEMLSAMFNEFPKNKLYDFSGYFFVPLALVLVNDESSKCRKLSAITIKLLLQKLDKKRMDNIYDIVKNWAAQEKLLLRNLSFQILGIMAEVEKRDFEVRLENTWPHLYTVLKISVDEENEENQSDKDQDTLTFSALTFLVKLTTFCDLFKLEQYVDKVDKLFEYVQELLLHPHGWVRLSASQFLGLVFAEHSSQLKIDSKENFLSLDSPEKVKELFHIVLQQLQDDNITSDLADQVAKNLIYITRLALHVIPVSTDKDVEGDGETKQFSMESLIRKVLKIAAYESSHSPKQTIKRMTVFRWIAAMSKYFNADLWKIFLVPLLRPLYRETTSSQVQDSDMVQLANEVIELIRSSIGKDVFAVGQAELQIKVSEIRESRKRKMAVQAVLNPEKSAEKKQKHNLAKKLQRKRKLEKIKPHLAKKKAETIS